MSFTGEQIGDDQLIKRYLLGSLGAEEAELYDELSIADDEFATRLDLIEHELIDAYVNGELSEGEREEFRARYFSSPIRREKVAFAQTLRAAAEQARSAPVGRATGDGPEDEARFFANWLSRLFPKNRLLFPWAPIAAALLLMVVAGVWLWREDSRRRRDPEITRTERDETRGGPAPIVEQPSIDFPPQEAPKATPELKTAETPVLLPTPPASRRPVVATFVLSPALRSAGSLATLNIPRDAEYVSLQIKLEPNDYTRYRTMLKTWPDEKIVWQSGELKARAASGGQRSIFIRLRSRQFNRQKYVLEVAGLAANGTAEETIGTYPFVVTNKTSAK